MLKVRTQTSWKVRTFLGFFNLNDVFATFKIICFSRFDGFKQFALQPCSGIEICNRYKQHYVSNDEMLTARNAAIGISFCCVSDTKSNSVHGI